MSPAGTLFPGSIPFEEDTARTRAAGAAALLAALFDDHEALERLPYEDLAQIATSINDDHLALLARLGPSLAPRLSAGLRRHTQQDTTRTRPPYGLLDTAVLVHAADTAPAIEATLSYYRARRIIVKMVIGPETDERDVATRKRYRQWAKQALEALRAPLSQPALLGDGTDGAPGAGAATASPDGADRPDERAEVVRAPWVAMEQSGLLTGRRPRTLTPDLILADPKLRIAADEPLGFARDVLHAEGLCDWIPAEGEVLPPYDQFLLLGQKLSDGAAGIEDVVLQELVDEDGHLVPRADHHQCTDLFRLHWTEHGTPAAAVSTSSSPRGWTSPGSISSLRTGPIRRGAACRSTRSPRTAPVWSWPFPAPGSATGNLWPGGGEPPRNAPANEADPTAVR